MGINGGRKARMTIVAVGGAAALLAFGAVALAAFTAKSKRITVSGAGEPSTAVTCPRGSEAVSGGYVGGRFNQAALQRLERVSGRTLKFRFQNQTPDASHATVSALCARPALHLVKATTTGTVTGAGTALTATCPTGMKAISGGVSIPRATVLFVQSFRRQEADKWRASFYTEGRPDPGVKVFAMCASHPGPIHEVARTRTLSGSTRTPITARCDPDEQVVSGGWEGELSFSPVTIGTVEGSAHNGLRAWTSIGRNATGSNADFTTYAYCLRS